MLGEVKLHIIPPGGAWELPPFSLQFLRVAHSIPEAQALAIRTPHGTVLHTGDWKLDPHPLIGPPTDEAAFAALGDQGVLAMVCDSTNAMVEGHSGSEADVRRSLAALIRDLRGRVAVTCFASNVARLESVALAARDAGRSVALVGRSLRNIEAAARECGYLAARAGLRGRGRHRRHRRRQSADPGDRQPGRAAFGAGPHRRRPAPARGAGRGRHGGVLQPRHPRQRAGDYRGAGRAGAARRAADDRGGPHGSRLGPPGARRAAPPLSAGAAALLGAGAWRVAPPRGARGAGAGGGRHPVPDRGWRRAEPRPGPAGGGGQRRQSGGSRWTARGWCRWTARCSPRGGG